MTIDSVISGAVARVDRELAKAEAYLDNHKVARVAVLVVGVVAAVGLFHIAGMVTGGYAAYAVATGSSAVIGMHAEVHGNERRARYAFGVAKALIGGAALGFAAIEYGKFVAAHKVVQDLAASNAALPVINAAANEAALHFGLLAGSSVLPIHMAARS